MTESLVLAVLLALAAWRLWRLVALDFITEGLRERLVPEGTTRFTFVNCPWCLGTWLTAGLWALAWSQVPVAVPGLVLGAAAGLTGALGTADVAWHSR